MNVGDLLDRLYADQKLRRVRYALVGGVALFLLAVGGWIDGANQRAVVARDGGVPRCVVVFEDESQRVTAQVGTAVTWPGMRTVDCP